MRSYNEYLQRKRAEFGTKFDPSDLAAQFVPAFESGARIRVKDIFGQINTGTVGVTTGWKPSFILLPRSDSRGSSLLLSHQHVFTTEKMARYVRKPYQPKTGEPCGCRRGVERDNCAACEGTGMRIDFKAIRAHHDD